MTNEEIEKKADNLALYLVSAFGDFPQRRKVLANALYALVSQAYEEAIQIAKKQPCPNMSVDDHSSCGDCIADEISVLKDSLAQETVPT